ncbi:hypothetical protein PTKIN_Ptkin03bG0092200 [Pterospermum kingtungense]
MAEDIQSLLHNISILDDEEEDLVITKSWVEESVKKVKNCFLGKMLIHKPYRIEGMKAVFRKIWRLESSLTIQDVGDHMFVFQFEDDLEKDRVLMKQPWAFNKSLLLLQEFDGMCFPKDVEMYWCPFWMQVHGLPIGLM